MSVEGLPVFLKPPVVNGERCFGEFDRRSTLTVLGLFLRVQKADDREKRQEAHRFHFDAM